MQNLWVKSSALKSWKERQMNKLLQSNGEPVQYAPVIKWQGWTFPVRVLNEEVIKDNDPKALIGAVLVQLNDKDNLLWAGLVALAKDIYDRDPSKSTEFLDFVKAMGLHLTDGHGKRMNVEEELEKVLVKN